MRPTRFILPFLIFNLIYGFFNVLNKNKYELYPLTIYNLYSRIISTTNYKTILYRDQKGGTHNLALESKGNYTASTLLSALEQYPEIDTLEINRFKGLLNTSGSIYYVNINGDSRRLLQGELIAVDTIAVL